MGRAPDERGIPNTLMADGAPNGYSIMTFDGHDYSLDFRAAGRRKDYQMQIHTAEAVPVNQLEKAVVFANVFNGSEKSQVEMKLGEDGDWMRMTYTQEADPTFLDVAEWEKSLGKVPWRNLPKPADSMHLWKANLPAGLSTGTYFLHVRAKNFAAPSVTGRRVIRITPASESLETGGQ